MLLSKFGAPIERVAAPQQAPISTALPAKRRRGEVTEDMSLVS